ncbi:hypothetical protein FRB91_002197 [Serendipita sp. 411]|nr:hypothetical protein FRB91_002197 [Serendipita sp. 411]KAG8845836.1 hypothetical protein FRC20_003098 [Serendipita sp. 405]
MPASRVGRVVICKGAYLPGILRTPRLLHNSSGFCVVRFEIIPLVDVYSDTFFFHLLALAYPSWSTSISVYLFLTAFGSVSCTLFDSGFCFWKSKEMQQQQTSPFITETDLL